MDEGVAVHPARGRLEEPGAVASRHVEQAGDPRLPTSRMFTARDPNPMEDAGPARLSTASNGPTAGTAALTSASTNENPPRSSSGSNCLPTP